MLKNIQRRTLYGHVLPPSSMHLVAAVRMGTGAYGVCPSVLHHERAAEPQARIIDEGPNLAAPLLEGGGHDDDEAPPPVLLISSNHTAEATVLPRKWSLARCALDALQRHMYLARPRPWRAHRARCFPAAGA